MVGRLVQQQEVGPFQRQDGQRQPRPLAAAQHAHALEDVFAPEEILGQVAARLADEHVLVADELVQHRVLGVQPVLGLGKVADLEAGPKAQLALQRLQLAHQRAQKGGLARAVGADERGAFAPVQFDGLGGEERHAGVAHGHFARTQHQVAAAHGAAQAQAQLGRPHHGALQALDGLLHIHDGPLAVGDVHLFHDAAPIHGIERMEAACLHHFHLADEPA